MRPLCRPFHPFLGVAGLCCRLLSLDVKKKSRFSVRPPHASRLAHCPPLSSCTIAASTCAKHMPTCVVAWARSALAGGLQQREPNSAPGHSDVCACVLDNWWCVEVQLPNRPQNSAGDIRNCHHQNHSKQKRKWVLRGSERPVFECVVAHRVPPALHPLLLLLHHDQRHITRVFGLANCTVGPAEVTPCRSATGEEKEWRHGTMEMKMGCSWIRPQ